MEVNVKPQITVVGLGPGRTDLLTKEAWDTLNSSDDIYFRTGEHPSISNLPGEPSIHTFDSLYEGGEDFAQVYTEIVDQLVEVAKTQGDVVYAVPGDPFMGESTVLDLKAKAEEEGIRFVVKPGVSFIEPCRPRWARWRSNS
jgi:tetrapyrrole methylase family protein/MazG family protein